MPSRLSARQEQCVRLTAFRTDKEIAAHLGISEATVKKHVHEACQRLGVNRRKAALAILEQEDARSPKGATPETVQVEAASVSDTALGVPVKTPAVTAVPTGYRTPPRSPLLRLTMIAVIAVTICALLIAIGAMVGEIHQILGRLDPR